MSDRTPNTEDRHMPSGDRVLAGLLGVVLVVGLAAGLPGVSARDSVGLDAYAEWKRGGELIVDGQRVRADAKTKWTGTFTSIDAVPLGSEVRVTGARAADGAVVARQIDIRPNGPDALFESEVVAGTNQLESAWRQNGQAFEADGRGRRVIGGIETEGVHVDRVRWLVRRLAPPYVDQSKLRVYVIDNRHWNAMAMGNGAIWVYKGLLDDLSDSQLAIVVGHELAHYTHEHSRRQMRRGVWTQLIGLGAILGAGAFGGDAALAAAQLGASFTLPALTSRYGRDLEDQADRVGLRYAHEAGFPIADAPQVWQRFLDKYGQEDRVSNFFFSDHSLASARKKNLQAELAANYH
jgi:Zn-dependent protease with chaperone function